MTATQIITGRRPSTGQAFIATNDGQRIDFPPTLASGVAAMLAEFCTDDGQRWHVRDEWYELEDDETVAEMEAAWRADPSHENSDLPLGPLKAFPINRKLDVIVSIVATMGAA